MAETNSADGFVNTAFVEGRYGGTFDSAEDPYVFISCISPGIWREPHSSYGPHPSFVDAIEYAILEVDAWDKRNAFAPRSIYPLSPFALSPLGDINIWSNTSYDPPVMEFQNTEDMDLGYRTEPSAVTYKSLSVWWRSTATSPYWTSVGAWGLLDSEIIVQQYDTPVILDEAVKIGFTSITG